MTNKMTDEELNVAIHKWLGKCWHKWDHVLHLVCVFCGHDLEATKVGNPNYCKDHNAVREFLQSIQDRTGAEFSLHFWETFCKTDAEGSQFSNMRSIRKAVFATPRQLAEAGAKAVGIYEISS